MTISFKGAHFPKEVILYAVFFYLRYGVSYRDLEEIMAERGVELDHATLNLWVNRYAGLAADASRHKKRPTDRSWLMDETYVKVKGEWVYLYGAIDKHGKTLDFMLSKRRIRPMLGFKSFASAASALAGIELVNMIREGQFTPGLSPFQQFVQLVG
ncbi:IS6 family transposase [Ruegeria atlantica]|uniref:IS6 family transposase n=1 Tax=Ruegeria atlantica TaxID=81569 RepID=UPI00147F4F5B